jgi:hypothetical protein
LYFVPKYNLLMHSFLMFLIFTKLAWKNRPRRNQTQPEPWWGRSRCLMWIAGPGVGEGRALDLTCLSQCFQPYSDTLVQSKSWYTGTWSCPRSLNPGRYWPNSQYPDIWEGDRISSRKGWAEVTKFFLQAYTLFCHPQFSGFKNRWGSGSLERGHKRIRNYSMLTRAPEAS